MEIELRLNLWSGPNLAKFFIVAKSQCIMKERPLQKVEAGCGVPPLRRRQGVSGVPGAREPENRKRT